MLSYILARHLIDTSANITTRSGFSVYIDPENNQQKHPSISMYEGTSVHVDVYSTVPGVLMVDEIPGAVAGCSPGEKQSLDIFPMGITGRFSLHFHTQRGEQIQVATILVYPEP